MHPISGKSNSYKKLPSTGIKWVVLGVNNVCNLHCKMCDVGTKSNETIFAQNLTGTKPIDMPLELFREIVFQIARDSPSSKLGYAFTEPLIYRHLEDSLKLTKDFDIYTTITTNALNLSKKAEVIHEFGVRELYISLDGPEDTHNQIRGNKKSFQNAISGIERIYSFNQRFPISIFCVITEWNVGKLVEFVKYFSRFPIKKIGFMHTNYTSFEVALSHNMIFGDRYPATHSNVEQSQVENIDIDELYSEIKSIKETDWGVPIHFSPDIANKEELSTFYRKPNIRMRGRCNDIFTNIMIKSDGSVIPAHGRCYNIKIGNVYESEIREILNSNIFNQFKTDVIRAGGILPACTRCCSAFS